MLPNEPIWLTQTHSTIAVEAIPEHAEQTADASYTDTVNRVCVVLTADCLPLLICNSRGTKVAAIHAGWRGLAGGIIENTLEKLALPGSELLVWLGPAIGPQKFEVGNDVYDAFIAQDESARMAFIPKAHDKWLANLYLLATQRLNKLGVTAIYGGDYCTHTQSDLFFSYRRDHGKTGRMASAIWIQA
jgi:YfiH family protein